MKIVLQMLVFLSVIVMLIAQFITVPKEDYRGLGFIFFGSMIVCAGSIIGLVVLKKASR